MHVAVRRSQIIYDLIRNSMINVYNKNLLSSIRGYQY